MKKIFRARAIITSDWEHRVFHDGFLAIENDKILDVGEWKKRPRERSFAIEDVRDRMITPSLFNLHTHLPMTLVRGLAEDLPLETWLFKHIFPLEAKWVSENFVRVGAELGLLESIRNGVGFLIDMYYYENEIAEAADRYKLRGIFAQSVLGLPTPDSANENLAYEKVRKLARRWKDHPRIIAGIGPHAPYTCPPPIISASAQLARELDIPAVIHLSETKTEFDDIQKRYQKTPTEYLNSHGLFETKRTILAHAVWLTDSDIQLLKKPNLALALNPQCNAKLASGIPPVKALLNHGVSFGLGTDGPASNNNMDMFSELNFLAKLYRVSQNDLTTFKRELAFDSVTRLAAKAAGVEEQLGSLEVGKQADFILIDLKTPHLTPLTDPYSHLVYSVQGPDVESLYVAGKPLMKNRKIRIADETKVLRRAEDFWKKIQRSLR